MTANDIYIKALAIFDEISKTTGLPDLTKTQDYYVRSIDIIDTLQRELMEVSGYTSKYEISCKPIENMFGFASGFDIVEFDGSEQIIEVSKGNALCYYFECDGDGTIYIEDYDGTWNTLATINATTTSKTYEAYSGVLVPTPNATKTRIRLTGTYYYRMTNYALFDIPFSALNVPIYQPWVRVELPSDAKEIIQVINEYPIRQYSKDSFYKTERNGNIIELYLDYYYEGKVRVIYKPYPTRITDFADVLQIDDITSQAIAYGLCRWFAISEENLSVATACEKKFNELKTLARTPMPANEEKIVDIYFNGWGW